jgi:hypothetical protein
VVSGHEEVSALPMLQTSIPPSMCLLPAEVFLFPLAQLQITICVASSTPLCEEDQPVQQQQPTAVVVVALLHKDAKKPLFA